MLQSLGWSLRRLWRLLASWRILWSVLGMEHLLEATPQRSPRTPPASGVEARMGDLVSVHAVSLYWPMVVSGSGRHRVGTVITGSQIQINTNNFSQDHRNICSHTVPSVLSQMSSIR